jgi:hypothetical protein
MKTALVVLAIVVSFTTAALAQSTYDPFQPRQNASTLGTPRSFEPPQQPAIRPSYQTPPNVVIEPGLLPGFAPRAYDGNTYEPLRMDRRSDGGYDITRY